MEQTSVEWLYERLERMIPRTALYNINKKEYFEQAKEMQNQQQDEFAIEFVKWAVSPETSDLLHDLEIVGEIDINITPEKLLEIYKKEKGL